MMDRDKERALFGEPSPKSDAELTRGFRHWPFTPSPPIDIPHLMHILRIQLPDQMICETLIDIALTEVGVTLMAFTPEYVENTIVPTALCGKGPRALHNIISLYALLGIGAILAVPGPGEIPEVSLYADLSGTAIFASAPAAVSTIELIEGMYARGVLEYLRQGRHEEITRSTHAMACKMCYDVSLMGPFLT
jgi:hypothetical protein